MCASVSCPYVTVTYVCKLRFIIFPHWFSIFDCWSYFVRLSSQEVITVSLPVCKLVLWQLFPRGHNYMNRLEVERLEFGIWYQIFLCHAIFFWGYFLVFYLFHFILVFLFKNPLFKFSYYTFFRPHRGRMYEFNECLQKQKNECD